MIELKMKLINERLRDFCLVSSRFIKLKTSNGKRMKYKFVRLLVIHNIHNTELRQ